MTHMFQALDQGDEQDPQYNDAVQFSPGRYRIHPTYINTTRPPPSPGEVNERTHLLLGIRPTKNQFQEWINVTWKRTLILNVFPVAVVLAWCAVPFPTYVPSNTIKHFGFLSDINIFHLPNHDDNPVEINFWFFLFFYYGFYNAIALLMVTKMFDLYSLNWWPKWLGGYFAYTVFWLLSLISGVIIYLHTSLVKYNLTWVLLTFITMNMPLLVGFIVIRGQTNRLNYRRSLTLPQKTFFDRRQLRHRLPKSYVRFLWFCFTLFIVIAAFIAGEAYAYVFLTTPEAHSGVDAFVYVYSWLATIYILDAVTEYIIESRVKSYPLQFTFKLYFFMIYFIFYRNLFARLRDPDQYILIQAASSLWVCIFYPLCMTQTVHKNLVCYIGLRKDYDDYKKQCGRSFFIRNLAENATMLGFICWICIIHYGPNYEVYPYFKFIEEGNPFDFDLTLRMSCIIWTFELASAAITRIIFRKVFKHSISKDAVKDFDEYPEIVVAMIVIIIHVLQDMLMALLNLNFKDALGSKHKP
ncbi:transmembrane transporter [Gigaspora margarita]|uniref:Transmembrane transporter n=2 Tax=Gigaspora margarita TaxID=4874 RepID=A0A8H4A697_GIGMA|nr:transmembrane transporter [Gigaspora margarita]